MDVFSELQKLKEKGEPCMLVTVVEKHGEGPVEVGKKMVVGKSEVAYGTVGGGALEYFARNKCKELIKSRSNLLEKYNLYDGKIIDDAQNLPMACGGTVTLFYEFVGAKANIHIFGAGHVGQALTKILKTMNFHVTVIDPRKEVVDAFVGGDVLINKHFVDYILEENVEDGSYVVVCTPSHQHDYNVLNKIIELNIKPKYIGMLCSIEKLSDYLDKTTQKFGKDINLENFYSPIGLNTGGGSPEEIAISISAEILAVLYDKKAHNHMRDTGVYDKYCNWKN